MGYTHYWNIKEAIAPIKFEEWSKGVRLIADTAIEAGVALGDGMGEGVPVIDETVVALNGVGGQSHETFSIRLGDIGSDFCKTAQKPYDAVVTASLIHAKVIFGKSIALSSDGSWDDWQMGRVLYETVFGVEPLGVFINE